MTIDSPDDIDELFSELKKESRVKYGAQNIKPKHIKLEPGKYALGNVVLQSISTAQLEYDEQQRTYFVCCEPVVQPFINNIISHWGSSAIQQLKLALVSATTNKVAIMRIAGVEVTKQAMDNAKMLFITLELDKESNTNDINSTGIRLKMNVLDYDHELDYELTVKRDVVKQYEDAIAAARRVKEIEDQKKAEFTKTFVYNEALSALTELAKTDSSLEYADPNSMISKFLSVIMKANS